MTAQDMNIVYNSDHFYVVDYPVQEGVELVDKESGLGTFLRGESAKNFRDSIQSVIADSATVESVDEFLSGFESLLTQRVVYH